MCQFCWRVLGQVFKLPKGKLGGDESEKVGQRGGRTAVLPTVGLGTLFGSVSKTSKGSHPQ